MKNSLILFSIVMIAFIVMALTTNDDQDTAPITHAIIKYSTAGNRIYIYYGGKVEEEVVIKMGESPSNKIVDLLNDLSKKGFELASSNTHAYNDPVLSNKYFIEFYYILKKSR